MRTLCKPCVADVRRKIVMHQVTGPSSRPPPSPPLLLVSSSFFFFFFFFFSFLSLLSLSSLSLCEFVWPMLSQVFCFGAKDGSKRSVCSLPVAAKDWTLRHPRPALQGECKSLCGLSGFCLLLLCEGRLGQFAAFCDVTCCFLTPVCCTVLCAQLWYSSWRALMLSCSCERRRESYSASSG